MATAKVSMSSDLNRRAWMREGLIQSAEKSFWAPLTGTTYDGVVFMVKNTSAKDGHTVVFSFDGNLSGRAIEGREQAFGKGEQKRLFSDKLTVQRYRLVVNNGDRFDATNIDELASTEHTNSRAMLSDLFQRVKDQALFDVAQGISGQDPTHIIDLKKSFGYNELLEIERTLKESKGFSTGDSRMPLKPYRTQDGRDCWLFVMDPAMAFMLRSDSNYQSLVYNADVRGNGNRAFKGVFGKIGSLILMETNTFFGSNVDAGKIKIFSSTEVESSGLRQQDENDLWTGQKGHSRSGDVFSRGLLLGAGALQMAFGKEPEYKWQKSTDFGIVSESACEFWATTKKTKLTTESGDDYAQAKVSGLDFGVVAVDVQVK